MPAPRQGLGVLLMYMLAASGHLAWGRVRVGLNSGKNGLTGAGAVDGFNWPIGAYLRFDGRRNVRVLVGNAKDRTASLAEATTVHLGHDDALSNRAARYAAVGRMDNNDASAAALGVSIGTYAPGSNVRSAIGGLRHIF
ncbi:MAG TPA: porin [Burkholderiaceae bacterium]|nr:porin [Burkholderiaceae bacterium]